MDTLFPINNTLIDTLADLKSRLDRIERTRQPYLGDWYEITEPITYVSANSFKFTNTDINATTKLSVSDKIKLTQSGTTKYFYVYKIDSVNVYITGGSTYTYTNTASTYLGRGLVPNPIGFPKDGFAYTVAPTGAGCTWAIGVSSPVGSFRIVEGFVFTFFNWFGANISGSTPGAGIFVNMPIARAALPSADENTLQFIENNFTYQEAWLKADLSQFELTTIATSGFSNTTNGNSVACSIYYTLTD